MSRLEDPTSGNKVYKTMPARLRIIYYFGVPARFIYKRYARCRADRVDTRALAHLPAPQIRPHIQSKQKSQPTFPPTTKGRVINRRLNDFKLKCSKSDNISSS